MSLKKITNLLILKCIYLLYIYCVCNTFQMNVSLLKTFIVERVRTTDINKTHCVTKKLLYFVSFKRSLISSVIVLLRCKCASSTILYIKFIVSTMSLMLSRTRICGGIQLWVNPMFIVDSSDVSVKNNRDSIAKYQLFNKFNTYSYS